MDAARAVGNELARTGIRQSSEQRLPKFPATVAAIRVIEGQRISTAIIVETIRRFPYVGVLVDLHHPRGGVRELHDLAGLECVALTLRK
jgi:hypothetical protein